MIILNVLLALTGIPVYRLVMKGVLPATQMGSVPALHVNQGIPIKQEENA